MPKKSREKYAGAFYHVTQRGVDKRLIFIDNDDFKKFIIICSDVYENHKFKLHAFCLMNNHYHFLIQTYDNTLSEIMHDINLNYSRYFNQKYDRQGHLFQSTFWSNVVWCPSEYMFRVFRYIFRNPCEAKLVEKPEEWRWSNYETYFKERKLPDFLETEFMLKQFSKVRSVAVKKLKSFVENDEDDYIDFLNLNSILTEEILEYVGNLGLDNKSKLKASVCLLKEKTTLNSVEIARLLELRSAITVRQIYRRAKDQEFYKGIVKNVTLGTWFQVLHF